MMIFDVGGAILIFVRTYYVYILSNKKQGTLYIGVTNNLIRRVIEHKTEMNEGFSKRYQLKRLVYFETTHEISAAIWREKCLKKWYRTWKIRLIESMNPMWRDLYDELT